MAAKRYNMGYDDVDRELTFMGQYCLSHINLMNSWKDMNAKFIRQSTNLRSKESSTGIKGLSESKVVKICKAA
ncbi:hypothetical protein GIB67_037633 [Kingdonia uniflora]|uniref:Uncharacterized protein n=1 Tax=Kingdonia uniflora TaxID=39325 RepID=A0A7J7LSV3_9MAGN|nr:hypothetical protein GIB67_037633 [Kingdonia uniflora]